MIGRLYTWLLGLYPAQYREAFSAEMLRVFQQAADERRKHGHAAFAHLVLSEFVGIIAGAAREWLAAMRAQRAYTPAAPSLQDDVMAAEIRVRLLVNSIDHAIAHHDFETVLGSGALRARPPAAAARQVRPDGITPATFSAQ